jgi:hypothetical protein
MEYQYYLNMVLVEQIQVHGGTTPLTLEHLQVIVDRAGELQAEADAEMRDIAFPV